MPMLRPSSRVSNVVPILAFLLGIALLIGCGGGGGGGGGSTGSTAGSTTAGSTTAGSTTSGSTTSGSTTSGSTTSGSTTSGSTTSGSTTAGGTTGGTAFTRLNDALRSGTTNVTTLAALSAEFDALVSASGVAEDARTGSAIVKAALVSERIFALYPTALTDVEISSLNSPLLDTLQKMRLSSIGGGQFLPTAGLIDVNQLLKVIPFLGQLERYDVDGPTPWEIQATLASSRSEIGAAISALSAIPSNAPDTLVADLTPEGAETSLNATAGFGEAERRALLGWLQCLSAQEAILRAYDWRFGTFDPNAAAITTYNTEFTAGDPLPVARYFAGSPFLTKAGVSTTALTAAKTTWKAAGDSAVLGLNAFAGRTGDHIFATGQVNDSTVVQALANIASYQGYPDGPVSMPSVSLVDGSVPLLIDLSVLFDTPPNDLKVFFPELTTYEADASSYGIEVDLNSTVDTTWAGIFPDGVDTTTFLERGDVVTSTWDRGDVMMFAWDIYP